MAAWGGQLPFQFQWSLGVGTNAGGDVQSGVPGSVVAFCDEVRYESIVVVRDGGSRGGS